MAETITSTNVTTGATVSTAQGIDYAKIGEMLDGKLKATEDSFLKGYLKQQGITGDEMNQAIEMFKKEKESREPNIDALNQQIADKENEIAAANKRALLAETKVQAMSMASELGVEQKVIPYLLKMADLSAVISNGQIDQEKLKESLNEVITDLPQLKITAEEKGNGFKIGADAANEAKATQDELARIFGVKMK